MLKSAICTLCVLLVFALGCSGTPKNPSSSDPKERAQALNQLALKADEKAVAEVAPLARHEDARTAMDAIAALGRMKTAQASVALRQVVISEQRMDLRKAAVVSLGQRDDPQAAEALRQVAVADKAPEVRAEAALGLGRVGTADDVQMLATATLSETDPRVIQSQVKALEALCGVKFPYKANASEAERKEVLERVRTAAAELAERKKGIIPAGVKCRSGP